VEQPEHHRYQVDQGDCTGRADDNRAEAFRGGSSAFCSDKERGENSEGETDGLDRDPRVPSLEQRRNATDRKTFKCRVWQRQIRR